MNFVKKSISTAVIWNFSDRFFNQGIRFILNIFIARLLFPSDYGLIGMITIFIAIGQSFIEGGFINALIQKQNKTEKDFSTTFLFNISIGIILYLLIFLFAPLISSFYKTPELTLLLRVTSLTIIINSFGVVPSAIFLLKLDFKSQAISNFFSAILSGFISIILAINGLGVWALIVQAILQSLIINIFFWFFINWKPKLIFSFSSFKELWYFGSKLLLTNLIDRIFRNFYSLIIGKFYNASQLGYYNRAEQFSQLPSSNIAGIIQNVTFPKMCELQDDTTNLLKVYKRSIIIASFISFPIMLYLSFFSKPIIIFTLTSKWVEIAPFLVLLSLAGIIYPFNFLNMNLLLAKKQSVLYLKLEVIKKILIILMAFASINFGIIGIIYGQIIIAILSFLLNSYYTNKLIGYKIYEQFMDILPFFLISLTTLIFALNITSNLSSDLLKISLGLIISLCLYLPVIYFLNLKNIKNDFTLIFNLNKNK